MANMGNLRKMVEYAHRANSCKQENFKANSGIFVSMIEVNSRDEFKI